MAEITPLESIVIPVGAVHRLENPWPDPLVVVVEVQGGEILSEEDIVRLEDDYHRVRPSGDR